MRFDLGALDQKVPLADAGTTPIAKAVDSLFGGVVLTAPAVAGGGQPLMLNVDSIDEGADQPRQQFDQETLEELAETIRQRGVRQPVSVRPHPTVPDRWILNFGARRLRASKLAGKAEIPAFVDRTIDDYDQVIENEQRENLTSFELAMFVQRRLAIGESRAEVARRLGKSRAYLTIICALIDAPPWLIDLYRSGRCPAMTQLYELRRLSEIDSHAVELLVAGGQPIYQAQVAALKLRLARSGNPPEPSSSQIDDEPAARPSELAERAPPALETQRLVPRSEREASSVTAGAPGASKAGVRVQGELVLLGRVDGASVRVLMSPRPGLPAHVYVEIGSSRPQCVAISTLTELRLVERDLPPGAEPSGPR